MELRQLRYFAALAEEQHVGRAAARVHITQPGLSQQIRKLEAELRVPLIERHSKGIRLTPAGETLLPFARAALCQVQDATVALQELIQLEQGVVTVGTLQTVNAALLPKAVARLTCSHPGIHVSVHELSAREIELGVEQGRLDLGIGFVSPIHRTEVLEAAPLFEEDLVLIVPRQHSLARRRRLPLRQLAGVSLVLLSQRFRTREILDEAVRTAKLGLRIAAETDTVHSLLSIVREADLGTVLPRMAVPLEERDLRCIRLSDPMPSRSVGLIWRRGGFRSHASRALEHALRSVTEKRMNGRG